MQLPRRRRVVVRRVEEPTADVNAQPRGRGAVALDPSAALAASHWASGMSLRAGAPLTLRHRRAPLPPVKPMDPVGHRLHRRTRRPADRDFPRIAEDDPAEVDWGGEGSVPN